MEIDKIETERLFRSHYARMYRLAKGILHDDDDARLDSIMTDVSARYGIEVDYENDTLRQLRFHLKWNRSRPIADVMEVVNGFEGISMSPEGGKVIVKEVFEDETDNEQDNE